MIDPITYSELLVGDVIGNMYESFAGLDAEGNVVPSLATSWAAHDDNRGFRFHLRAGVSFHSGRKLTAADVKWSLEQLLIPGNRGGLNAKYAASIEGAGAVQRGDTEELSGVTAVDELTLDVRFREAEVLFPIYPIYIMDRGVVDEHGEDWPSWGWPKTCESAIRICSAEARGSGSGSRALSYCVRSFSSAMKPSLLSTCRSKRRS